MKRLKMTVEITNERGMVEEEIRMLRTLPGDVEGPRLMNRLAALFAETVDRAAGIATDLSRGRGDLFVEEAKDA